MFILLSPFKDEKIKAWKDYVTQLRSYIYLMADFGLILSPIRAVFPEDTSYTISGLVRPVSMFCV